VRDTINEKTFDYLTKAASAANSELDKPYPMILLCEENLAQYKMLPRLLHCLAIRVRLDEPVHDQLDTIKRICACYAGMTDQERKAREYASILINAGQEQYNTSLSYFSLKLKMDPREALKYAIEGVKYQKNHYDKVVLKQTKQNDPKDDDDVNAWENQSSKFPCAYEKLKLACALLVEAQAYVATGEKGMSESPLNEATKLLKPYTSKTLQDENLWATLGLYQKATDLQKQLQRQLSSKH